MKITTLLTVLALSISAFGCAAATETPDAEDEKPTRAVAEPMTIPDYTMETTSVSRGGDTTTKTSFAIKLAAAADGGLVH